MQSRPFTRTFISQAVALAGFIVFLGLMSGFAPRQEPSPNAQAQVASAAVFISLAEDEPKEAEPDASEQPKLDPPPKSAPRRPERFRPATQQVDESSAVRELPAATPRALAAAESVATPPRDLPLSYLMKFRSMSEFHAFLDKLPDDDAGDRAMSLIRIEGLPRTVSEMRRLFQSYRMASFLFNPERFNYLITADQKLLRDRDAINAYIASVGRYLREDEPNAAYAAIRNEIINRIRSDEVIRKAITDEAEFARMKLGLASPHLSRFFRKLEDDTARQLSELTGRPVAVGDIARIDCRFKDVNGVMVLVPWRAYLGTGPERGPVTIWRQD